MQKEAFAIAKHYGDDCSKCKEVCCVNMALDIGRNETKRIAKSLNMDASEFRKKYTVLLKQMTKGAEMKCMSPEAKMMFDKNLRLLKFIDHPIDDFNLDKEQKERLVDFSKGNKDLKIMACPFYNIKEHKCTIHQIRPLACYLYPFNYGIENQIDLRKINACIISTNFLKRISEFIQRMGGKTEYLEKTLKDKEYQNHFYLPAELVYGYIISECFKLKIRIESPILKKTMEQMLKHHEAAKK